MKKDPVLTDLAGMTQAELEAFIIAQLHELAISAQRIEMLNETRDSIEEHVAEMEARFPRKLSA